MRTLLARFSPRAGRSRHLVKECTGRAEGQQLLADYLDSRVVAGELRAHDSGRLRALLSAVALGQYTGADIEPDSLVDMVIRGVGAAVLNFSQRAAAGDAGQLKAFSTDSSAGRGPTRAATPDRLRGTLPQVPLTADNPAMAWKLRGTYVETCSCEFFCPCNFNLANGADYDRCRVTLVFNITDGDVEGTDVSGLAVVVIVDTPKVMTDGNWRLGTVIDAKASDEQAEKLQAVFSGELGGPMAALGPLDRGEPRRPACPHRGARRRRAAQRANR